ncbi:lachesin-like protein [Leptotrombidium deliense]|uniref:Lachesin-like protein n=1 Tax=Leptotrombidium deliense TaxID=299467 RepID=A0A443SGD8_9ACAR|nr:lachesin-like protein [Leptotrombidium deliense]
MKSRLNLYAFAQDVKFVIITAVSPLIWTPKQMVGAPLGSDVTLECNLESHPHSVTFWTKNLGSQIIVSNAKYDSIIVEGTSSVYKSEIRLRIKDLKPSDFTDYTCVARNALGETRGTIQLYEIPKPSTQTSDIASYTSSSREIPHRKKYIYYHGTKSSVVSEDSQSGNLYKFIFCRMLKLCVAFVFLQRK